MNFDIKLIAASSPAERALDIEGLTTAIEDFNTIFIRLPSVRRFSFSTLSVLHTLARRGPLRLTDLTATEQLKQPARGQRQLITARPAPGSLVPDPADELVPVHQHPLQGARADDRVFAIR